MEFHKTYNNQFVSQLIESQYGIKSIKLIQQGSFNDINFKMTSDQDERFLVKITLATKLPYIQIQNQAMLFLNSKINQHNLECCQPIKNQELTYLVKLHQTLPHYLRIFKFIQGTVLADKIYSQETREIFEAYGSTLATITKQFKGFSLTEIQIAQLKEIKSDQWNLKHALNLQKYMTHLEDGEQILVKHSMQEYKNKVVPLLDSFKQSLIHNDLHTQNILFAAGTGIIKGIIDFGDIAYTCRIFQLAIGVTSAMHGTNYPLQAACEIIKGYSKIERISEDEMKSLYYLVLVRDSTELTMSRYQLSLNPQNQYIFDSVKGYLQNLKFMISLGFNKFYDAIRHAE